MFAFPQRSSHTTVQHGDSDCPKWPHVGKPRLPTRVCVLCVLYELYVYVYVCACDMYVNNIYIHSTVYIYTICTWMDMYIVHTCLCIYLCMHVLLITINAFRIIRAVARSHPLSSTPSFCCRWRPSQGDQLIDSTNKNEGINPTLVRLVTTGSEIDAMFLLLLSVCCRFKKSISYGALGKLLLFS